jgi:two-component system sensor histidine kinase VicK
LPNNHSDITQVLYGDQKVNDALSQLLSRQNGIVLCSDTKTTARVLDMFKKKMSFDSSTERGVKIRFLTDINADNLSSCKELMKLTREVRHLEGIKANFAVRNKEYIGIATLSEESEPDEHLLQKEGYEQQQQQQQKQQEQLGNQEQLTQPQSHIIYSNFKGIIEQQQYLFNNLWEKSTPAIQRIKELEEGTESEFFKVITDNSKISQILIEMINSVVNEVLLLLPNDKALVRIDKLGHIDSLKKASQN